MATHRSLNKLEFKAHMSIHNKTEVPEGETHDSNYTRDRLGKSHRLSDADGKSRLWRGKKALALVAALTGALAFAPAAFAGHRNTDVQVESDPKFAFYRDDQTIVDLNEDGDPNMRMRF